VLALADLLAKTAAEEGRDIIVSMLVVGLIFVAVIVLGDLNAWRGHRRRDRS
jgi:heme/copper-type cytochrome/quinol oxidase subunit 2